MGTNWTGTTEHAFFQLSNHVLGTYNLWDSHFTAALVPELYSHLKELGQYDNYEEWIQPLAHAVVNMQDRGILVDRRALSDYKRQTRLELGEADAIILAADPTGDLAVPTGKYPNGIGSPKRLGKFLFQTLGLRVGKTSAKSNNPSTDQEALFRILRDLRKKDEHARPILEQLFHRSRLRTISQRYLDLPIETDGRVRASVNMAKVKTWRFSYDSPALQQYPPECRHIFRAAPGSIFLAADYRQLEARILAYLSGDQVSIRAFDEGRDIHNQNAMDLFEYLVEQWDALSDLERDLCRAFAKTFLYGISYGGATETIKMKTYCPCPKCKHLVPDTLNLSKARLKEVEIAWFTKHKAVAEFHVALKEQVEEHQFWDCPLGGRRQFFAPWSPELDRETKNAPMQTTAACLMNRKQVELDRLGAPIIMQKHDEFLNEVRLEDVNKYADMHYEIMEASYPDVGILSDISFPITIEIGETWGSLEKMTR